MVPPGPTMPTVTRSAPGNVKKVRSLSNPRASASSQALAYRKGLRKKPWTLSKNIWIPNTASCSCSLPIPDITWSLERSAPTRPGTRKMPESSATIIPGFPSQKPSLAEAIAHLRYIVKPVPLIWKISVTSTAPSLTFMHRWLPAQTLPDTVKQKTAG